MDYKQHLLDEIGRKTSEIHEIALSFQRMARETEVFLGQYVERRTDRNRGNRLPSYDERKRAENMNIYGFEGAGEDPTVNLTDDLDFDPTLGVETERLDTDLSRTPAEDLSLGRYEKSLVQVLNNLRGTMVQYAEAIRADTHGSFRTSDYKHLRMTLDQIRLAQRQLNATGHYKFLLS